jgi:hypothetical protein
MWKSDTVACSMLTPTPTPPPISHAAQRHHISCQS